MNTIIIIPHATMIIGLKERTHDYRIKTLSYSKKHISNGYK